jgi:hypothetical protein
VVAAAALQSADGAFLLGQMAPFTSAAGEWVFPCGTPEADDINAAGMLGLFGNLARELFEETGVNIATCHVEPGWTLVRDGGFVALIEHLDPGTLQSTSRCHYHDRCNTRRSCRRVLPPRRSMAHNRYPCNLHQNGSSFSGRASPRPFNLRAELGARLCDSLAQRWRSLGQGTCAGKWVISDALGAGKQQSPA